MHPIHPMVVHFPIALLSTSVLFEALALRWWPDRFRNAGLLTLTVGLASAAAAVLTGHVEEEAVEHSGIPEEILEFHEKLGQGTFWVFLLVLGLRLAMQGEFIRNRPWLVLAVGLVGVLVLMTAGYSGGTLVYEFGAGVVLQ